ncbi:hypothetical protein B0H63DRAFT_493701 [Podospora didyma]|uniref:Ketoreductase domain-containing protein n=1 Tax=Podospora didyma TaxID=330526 RepID=A0AAE0U1S8_9PEZI|nr:hypothetical protein B0H63DRAFT_493701 [Podospora didyma]
MALPAPIKALRFEPYPEIDPNQAHFSTKGNHVVITGGGGGLGSATAEAFAKSGASNISILGRTQGTLTTTKEKVEAQHPGTKIHTFIANMTDKKSVDEVISAAVKASGLINMLVANAAYLYHVKPFMDIDPDEWFRCFEVNVKGNFNLLRAFIPHAAPGATVAEVSSVINFPEIPGYSSYLLSKLAQHKVFNYPDLHVVSLHLGAMKTAMIDKLPEEPPTALPANFIVWATSPEGKFLRGKYVWANWDVTELKAMAKEIESTGEFNFRKRNVQIP